MIILQIKAIKVVLIIMKKCIEDVIKRIIIMKEMKRWITTMKECK